MHNVHPSQINSPKVRKKNKEEENYELFQSTPGIIFFIKDYKIASLGQFIKQWNAKQNRTRSYLLLKSKIPNTKSHQFTYFNH
jgi:hypothetical protein